MGIWPLHALFLVFIIKHVENWSRNYLLCRYHNHRSKLVLLISGKQRSRSKTFYARSLQESWGLHCLELQNSETPHKQMNTAKTKNKTITKCLRMEKKDVHHPPLVFTLSLTMHANWLTLHCPLFSSLSRFMQHHLKTPTKWKQLQRQCMSYHLCPFLLLLSLYQTLRLFFLHILMFSL